MNMVTTDGESARRPSFSSAGRSGSTGPCVRFEGIRLELSSFAGCSFDFAKDGSLVLSFSNFSGSVTLRSNSGRGTSSHDGLAHPLCSTSSEAGSLGVLDAEHAMEIDMALSQLEQESPKSGLGMMYSPTAMRHTCEGKDQLNSTCHHADSTKPGYHPENTVLNHHSELSLSAMVSPPSSAKIERLLNVQNSMTDTGLKRSTSVSSPTRNNAIDPSVGNTMSPSRIAHAGMPGGGGGGESSPSGATGRAGSRAVSPDGPSNPDSPQGQSVTVGSSGGLSLKSKGKRSRRTCSEEDDHEDDTGVLSAALKRSSGGRGTRGETKGNNSGRKRQSRQGGSSAGKENKSVSRLGKKSDVAGMRGSRRNKKHKKAAVSVVETPVAVAMEQEGIDMEAADGVISGRGHDAHDEVAIEVFSQNEIARSQERGRDIKGAFEEAQDSLVDRDEDMGDEGPPASSAAAAWIASAGGAAVAVPARSPPGPLSRFAKATVVDTLNEQSGRPGTSAGPMGRWGHSATMITESRMLVLGGQADDDAQQATLGDLYKFDFETYTWSRPMNCDSVPRAWHTASFIPGKNLLVIFGGERTVDGCPECLDDIMVLDTEIDLLYPPAISGKAPTSRSGHSAAMIGNDLIVFGGVRGRKWQNNVAVLDTERWHWRHPTTDGPNPAPRSYHSATVVGSLMVVFGGNNQDESFDKVNVLDTSKPRWEWTCPEVVGAAPAARTGHSAILLPDGHTILVHGGWDPEDNDGVKNFGDCYLLDTQLWEWSRGPDSLLGEQATGLRVGHTAVLARDGRGGVGESAGTGSRGWQAAFFGGQDGAGVRGAELAALSL